MTRHAYTYIRWSSEKQSDGASLERQTKLINAYVAKQDLVLADLSYKDAGISAAKGKNSTEGALGSFIEACQKGIIKRGSYLLVEAFDRLSRAEPMDALELFQQITKFGITIVTLDDDQAYDRESIKKNWTQLIIAFSKMVGAHDENEKRTRRVQDAWTGNRDDGGMITTVGPAWLKLVGPKPTRDPRNGERSADLRQWVKIPEQVAKVKRVFELATKGHGAPKIAEKLNEEGLPTMTDKSELWTPGVVMAMLKNENVIGIYQKRNGTDRREGYYPWIIKKDDFYTVDGYIKSRHRAGRHISDRVGSVFGNILFCTCGSKTRFVNGNAQYPYIRCISAYSNAGCDAPAHPYRAFEDSVLEALMWTFHSPLSEITQIKPDPVAALQKELEDKQARLERAEELYLAGEVVKSGVGIAVKSIVQLKVDIADLQQRIRSTTPALPFDDIAEQALVQLNTHKDLLEESVDSPELNALRLEMKGTIRLLLDKIVIHKEHTFVKYHPRAAAEFKRAGAMFGKYELSGPAVERMRPQFDAVGSRHILAPNLESLKALGDPTIDGMFGEFPMLEWAARDAIKRRRNRKR